MDSEFERKLSRQRVKQIPGEWRSEILATARARGPIRHSPFIILHSWLAAWLWPHPKAWAGLAAVWLAIFVLNYSTREGAPVIAQKSAPQSTDVAELRTEQKMLAELIGPTELRVADRQRVLSPKPRSERGEVLAA